MSARFYLLPLKKKKSLCICMQIKALQMRKPMHFDFKIPGSQGRSIYWCRQDFRLPEPPALVLQNDKNETVWAPLALGPGGIYLPQPNSWSSSSHSLGCQIALQGSIPAEAAAQQRGCRLPQPVSVSLNAVHGCQGDGRSRDSLSPSPHLSLGFFSS